MKLQNLTVSLFCSFLLAGGALAQAPKKASEKAPADVAGDAFNRLYNDKEAKVSQERFQQIVKAGIDFLSKYPAHWRANNVIRDTANFGNTITDKKLAAYKAAYVTQLKYELVTARYKEGLSDDGKAAMAALDAAAADFEVWNGPSNETLAAVREKIDELATMPGAGKFLADRELGYVEILNRAKSPAAGEAHLKKLTAHADKALAARAATELNLLDARRTPTAIKFTALDGRPVDFATLRGKVVVLAVWSGTGEGTGNFIDAVKQAQSFNKKTTEVIGMSFDKEADREKVTKFIKDQKFTWPVYFDGKEAKNEWAVKLNVTKGNALVVFDKKGLLVSNNLPTNQLETALQKLGAAK